MLTCRVTLHYFICGGQMSDRWSLGKVFIRLVICELQTKVHMQKSSFDHAVHYKCIAL